ncbi:MAG TPA: hypothetical protein VLE97_05955 [Gaiellaceae bacterium]|nr:hypothetical protein [Gaiellaceae bacterium]
MTGDGDRASELGRFAAREMLARLQRETGETWPPDAVDRMLFMYEMGYLRGRSDAAQEAVEMFQQGSPAGETKQEEEPRDATEPVPEPESKPEPGPESAES